MLALGDHTIPWVEGTGTDGSTFLVYIEDSGKPSPGGHGNLPVEPDVFKLWIDGVLQTPSDGSLTRGDVAIRTS